MTRTVTFISTNSESIRVLRTETYGWLTNGSPTATLLHFSEQALTLPWTWQGMTGRVAKTTIGYPGGGVRCVTNAAPDNSKTISQYLHSRLQAVTRLDTQGGQAGFAASSHRQWHLEFW